MSKNFVLRIFPYVCICILFLCVGLYRLDELPGEWFGDISNLHEYVQDIQKGKWPISYRQTVGPFYHYLITPWMSLTSQRYIDYKQVSVFSGLFSLCMVMVVATSLYGRQTAIISGFLLAVSFWHIVWSRLGNLHALIPGIISLSLYCLLLYVKRKKLYFLFLGLGVSCLGLFVYIPLVLLPFIYCLMVGLLLRHSVITIQVTNLFIVSLGVIITLTSILFIFVLRADPHEFFHPSGYIAEKFFPLFSLSLMTLLERFFSYSVQTIGMFFIGGDPVFRVSIPHTPLMDIVTSITLLIGAIAVVRKKSYAKYIIFVPLLLVIPAVFPSLRPEQIPSSTRTIVVLPSLYILAGVGGSLVINTLRSRSILLTYIVCLIGAIIVIGVNLYKYYVVYPSYFPNENSAYGKQLAAYIDLLPSDITVMMPECCFLPGREVDPKAIYYQLHNKKGRETLLEGYSGYICDLLDGKGKLILISHPHNSVVQTCGMKVRDSFINKGGEIMITMYQSEDMATKKVGE